MQVISKNDTEIILWQEIKSLIKKLHNLCLPTGNTPIVFYKLLVRDKSIAWQNINIFMLDSLYPQDPNDPNSYYTYIKNNLLDHIDLPLDNFAILNSNANDPQKECENYEKAIRNAGGIDLAILGLGQNGHIGFNEPGSDMNSVTRLVTLSETTLNANNPDNKIPNHPIQALTMGIKTILSSKKIYLLAKGKNKAQAVYDAIKGPINSSCPASFLQNHKDVTFFLDEEAASLIK